MAGELVSFGIEKLYDLLNADAKKHTSAVVRHCIEEIKEIVFDAEDKIETYLLKEGLRRTSKSIKKRIRRLACIIPDRREIASDNRCISKRISKVICAMKDFGVQQIILDVGDSQPLQERLREMQQEFPREYKNDLVGLDTNVKELVGYLVEEGDVQVRITIPKKDALELNKVDGEMEKMSKEMIKHCGVLPLAVRVLGGLLAEKYTLHNWKRVSENLGSHLCGRTYSFYYILSLSFEELPSYLKQCFLYLAHIPEDFAIDVEKLTYYWAAEGILKHEYLERESVEMLQMTTYKSWEASNWMAWDLFFTRLQLLRVLDLCSAVSFEGGKLPSGIGKLIHLRYLSLKGAK
ncbi:unnamed protein product, partial [Thlaspi arvense]